MEEIKEKINRLSKMKEKFVECMESEMTSGMASMDTKEAGEVVDIIKDLAEAEKYCLEACYYKTVIEAMEEGDDSRHGYNRNRDSNGRFTYNGDNRRGFRPYVDQEPYIYDYVHNPNKFMDNMRMGYRESNNGSGMNIMGYDSGDDRYGRAYRSYMRSRRNYTETNSQSAKEEMHTHANEHVMDTIATFREIWKNADPDLKKRMKVDLTNLLNEMTM